MVLGEGENFFSREKKFSPSPNPNPFQEKRSICKKELFSLWVDIFCCLPMSGTEPFDLTECV
jgi:hypothetical protein